MNESEWKISALTYNVNGQKPLAKEISKWLMGEKGLLHSHIVCIALQEISHGEMFLAVPQNSSWTDQLTCWMNENKFVLVNRLCLASNLLLIYSIQLLLPLIEKVDTKTNRSSFYGMAGYKGTISTRLLFKDNSTITFMTSHFFHGKENFQKRISQYFQSLGCTFEDDPTVYRRRIIIWLGDLNSRVECYTNSTETFIQQLNHRDLNDQAIKKILNGFDQLTVAKRKNEAFVEFDEANINFKPSYRILVGNGAYDPLRTPSWCDRILYRVSIGKREDLSVENYSSNRSIVLSDHYPVSALFKLSDTIQVGERIKSLWKCIFEHIPTWTSDIPFVCRFSLVGDFYARSGSYADWVGVYPTELEAVSKPIRWVYLLTCYAATSVDDSKTLVEFQSLPPGRYRMGYFSYYKNCLVGLSDEFLVEPLQQE